MCYFSQKALNTKGQISVSDTLSLFNNSVSIMPLLLNYYHSLLFDWFTLMLRLSKNNGVQSNT